MFMRKFINLTQKLWTPVLALSLSTGSVIAFANQQAAAETAGQAAHGDVYELRTYTTNEGKLPALHNRFRHHTMALFAKHGMRNIAYWIPQDTPDTLIYIVAHKSRTAADSNWQEFVNDPDWQQVYAASIAEGRLVKNIDSVFMSKTDYSP